MKRKIKKFTNFLIFFYFFSCVKKLFYSLKNKEIPKIKIKKKSNKILKINK